MIIVEGYQYLPFRAKIEGFTEDEFKKLSKEEQTNHLIKKGAHFERGHYFHNSEILYIRNDEQ